MPSATTSRDSTRVRIVEAAAVLLGEGGPAAVTTRGVAGRAGVQAPAIYRLFGDKDGLLEAVAEHVLATFVATKQERVTAAQADAVDPVDDLRASWDAQLDFGLANPALFRFLNDPERAQRSPAVQAGLRVLEQRVHRIAVAGRLRVAERRAVDLIRAAGVGTVTTILATPLDERDPGLATEVREVVLQRLLTDAPPHPGDDGAAAAVALRALAPRLGVLTVAERRLLAEWLDRVVDALAAGG